MFSLENSYSSLETIDSGLNYDVVMNYLSAYGIFFCIIGLLFVIELWVIFQKCGKKGWLSIVPIANTWTLFSISGLPGWLCLVPVANFVGLIVAYVKLPKRFGKSTLFGIANLLFPIIFMGILAFSKNKQSLEEAEEKKDDNPAAVSKEENNESLGAIPDLMESPVPQENTNINVVEEEKEFVKEEPALNVEENVEVPTAPIVETPSEPVTPTVLSEPVEEPVINAFDMPSPVMQNVDNNVQPVETLFNESLPEEENKNNLDDLEATFELPKMANEIINSDIVEKKVCPNCGYENEYTNKTCMMCGGNLE